MSDQAKKDLTRLYTEKKDYFPDSCGREACPSREDQLQGLSADRRPRVAGRAAVLQRSRLPQQHARGHGPGARRRVSRAAGFDGLGLDLDRSFKESSYAFHFPDGGASVARLLCKRIVPRAFDGEQNHETIVTARLRYERLDEESASVRIRLNSTVVRVQHEGARTS
jgi:hypothetical protein